ncbi:hypothetical protein [Nonomuraea jabiensis]|uniref:Uncharacterized protein n=1 Tax=Nonomuraea jabiensis TaxID=882448 RepID=A0A7W9LFQ4_9ACTN|nr:hypothetical protein [Nonomuraea jabiensis]MBB5782008.1 hypothetical protein [Nonomuraea jabiensis]
MPLPQIPLDDPRVLALAKARQQLAHGCTFLPTWDELTDKEREDSLPNARNYLESTVNAGLVPAVELIDSGWREPDQHQRRDRAAGHRGRRPPLLLYRFRTTPPAG